MQELFLQIDGASDNVNFANLHFFVWFLLVMHHFGYPLYTIHLCRLMVGHTHNDVDQRHSLSTASREAENPDLWSFTSFEKWLKNVHRHELKGFYDIHKVYDFKSFLGEMRHDADEKVSTWMHTQLEVRANGTVWARSKPRMGNKVSWDAWCQYYPPPPPSDHANTCPGFTATATPAPNKQWKDGPKVTRSLKKAYDPRAPHARLIPTADRAEMLTFLANGPPDKPPPQWFQFSEQRTDSTPTPTPTPTTGATNTQFSTTDMTSVLDTFTNVFDQSHAPVVSEHNRHYQPIGVARAQAAVNARARSVTGKRCRCGSIHHSRTNHRRCPLNRRNQNLITQPVTPQPTPTPEPPRTRARPTRSDSPTTPTDTDSPTPTPTPTPQSDTEPESDHNTDTDSDTDDDIPVGLLQYRPISVGRKVAKYFGDDCYFGRVTGLPKEGEKYFEIEYDDGDKETMKEIEVMRSISLYEEQQKYNTK